MDLYVISGNAGMTGSELTRQILQRKNMVIGFDNYFASSQETIKDLLEDENFIFFEYDLNSKIQMEKIEALVREKCNQVKNVIYINCAAVVHTEHFYHIDETFETNVLGMKSFLEQAIRVGANVFINCSTSEVYSMQSWMETGVKEEDYLLLANAEHSQRTSYATGKLLTEFFLKDEVEKGHIKGCSIRFANVYSKNEKLSKHIIPHIIESLMNTGEVTLLENSRKNRRTFLHNIDSCSAVLSLMDHETALDGSIYNVATEEEVSILKLVQICAEEIGIENVKIKYEGYRASDPERRMLNIEKIKNRTGWNPKITLREGIRMCVNEKKNRPKQKKTLIITTAGICSRFNKDQEKSVLKSIYYEEKSEDAILSHLLNCSDEADQVIIVGGYQFHILQKFLTENFPEIQEKLVMVYNPHYQEYGTGYSLYIGIKEAIRQGTDEVIFAEGDLFVEKETFQKLIASKKDAVSINQEPITADKSVVFYLNQEENIKYLYDINHQYLNISEPFQAIYNSGQIWKFTDILKLNQIINEMPEKKKRGTNLEIIQKYFGGESRDQYNIFVFRTWFNCNTIEDFRKICDLRRTEHGKFR